MDCARVAQYRPPHSRAAGSPRLQARARDPSLVYAGSAGGGVWKSTNGTTSWSPVFDKQHVGSIGAVAISQSDSNDVWVGTGEGNPRNDVSYGDGIYRSRDGGKNVESSRLAEYLCDREDRARSAPSRHGRRRRSRGPVPRHGRARHLPHDRWRQDVETHSRALARFGWGGPQPQHDRSERTLRRDVAVPALHLASHERRHGGRTLQVDRRGSHLDAHRRKTVLRPASRAASASRSPRAMRSAYTRSSKPRRGSCGARTTRARIGEWSRAIRSSTNGRSTTRVSSSIRTTKIISSQRRCVSPKARTAVRRGTSAARRSTAIITTCGSLPTARPCSKGTTAASRSRAITARPGSGETTFRSNKPIASRATTARRTRCAKACRITVRGAVLPTDAALRASSRAIGPTVGGGDGNWDDTRSGRPRLRLGLVRRRRTTAANCNAIMYGPV